MKKIYFILLLLSVVVLHSCGPTVFFAKPQPQNTLNKRGFKQNFRGNYYSDQDSAYLRVTEKIILREGKALVSRTRKQLIDSDKYQFRKDSIIESRTGKAYLYTSRNDTLEFYLPVTDTLFVVDNENLLRYFKGNYFLNYKISDKNWYVKKLSLEGNSVLILSEMKVPEDIQIFRTFTPIEEVRHADEPGRIYQYVLDPSKAQFRKFLDRNGFKNSTRFKRLK